jgi:uncharacterized protein (DUF1778 family)
MGGTSDDGTGRGGVAGEKIIVVLSSDDLDLVRSAADSEGISLAAFAAESMKRYARDVLADRRLFQVTDEAWQELTALLDGPPPDGPPRLRKLLDDEPGEEGR